MAKPHIMLLGPAWPYRGGPALFMTFLYEVLSTDYRVNFVNFRMMYPRILFPGTTPLDRSQEHYKTIPGPRLLHSLNPWFWWKTAQYLKKQNPDLIVFDWYQPFFGPMYFGIGYLLPRLLQRRVVFITENVISHEGRFVDSMLTKLGLYWSNAFLALSEKVERDIKPFAKNKPVFRSELPIFNGFRNEPEQVPGQYRKSFGFGPSDKVLLFFGYIRHYKGLDILLDALRILLENDPSYCLLIAGESYEDVGKFNTYISENHLTERVNFHNAYIDNEDVAKWFLAADVIVLPYRSATQSGILNMAYGFEKPVICTDVGGLGEFIDDGQTGILVKEPTPSAIAESIQRFYTLKESTDFSQFIRKKVEENEFQGVGNVIAEMLSVVKSQTN